MYYVYCPVLFTYCSPHSSVQTDTDIEISRSHPAQQGPGHTLKMDRDTDKVTLGEEEMDRMGVVEMDLVSIQYLNGKTVTGVCRSDDLTQNIRFTNFLTEVLCSFISFYRLQTLINCSVSASEYFPSI